MLVVLVKQRGEVYGETKEVTGLETKTEKDTRTERDRERDGEWDRSTCTHLYSRTYN